MWKCFRLTICGLALIGAFGTAASAQEGAVDPEQLIRDQTRDDGPGRLLDNFDLGVAARRAALRERAGISFAANYYLIMQSAPDADADVINGLANLAFRWDNGRLIEGEQTSVVGYLENRHDIAGLSSADFNARFGPTAAPNGFATEFTRLRQLYLRQTLFDDSLVIAAGKYSLRGNFGASRLTVNKFRGFQSPTLSRAPSTPWPVESVGLYGRWQPEGRRWAVSAGLVDADPDVNAVDFDITGPYALVSLHLHSEPWRMDSGEPAPRHQFQLTVYHQPETPRGPEGVGVLAVHDMRLTDRLELGLRYGIAERQLGAVRQSAAAALVLNGPFGRPRDGVGVGVGWAEASESRDSNFNAEIFYRLNVIEGFELTPSAQISETIDDRTELILGLRTGISF